MTRIQYVLLTTILFFGSFENSIAEMIEEPFAVKTSYTPKAFQFEFCGVRIPVEIPEVREQLKYELAKRRRFYQESRDLLLRTYRYKERFQKTLRSAGIPDDFFYLAVAESGLSNAVSPKGAAGFWQFMPETAAEFGLEISPTVDERFHPEKSTLAASRYFRRSYHVFKDWGLVATSYNLGIGGLQRQIETQDTRNLFELELNAETKAYIYRIVSLKHLLENPSNYGFENLDYESHGPIPFKTVSISENIESFAQFAEEHGSKRHELRILNPWLVGHTLSAQPDKEYQIKLPLKYDFRAEELLTDSMRQLMAANPGTLAENRVLTKE